MCTCVCVCMRIKSLYKVCNANPLWPPEGKKKGTEKSAENQDVNVCVLENSLRDED